MALREGALKVGFRGGVDTKSDAKTVPSTQLLVAENVVFSRATSLRKRNGYEDLGQVIEGSATPITGAIRMATRDGELLQFTPTACFSRETGAAQWSSVGQVICAVATDRQLIKTGTQQSNPDCATLSGVTVAAWEDSLGGVYWGATDTSGRLLVAPQAADANGRSPRCVAVGGNLHIYYAVPTQHRVMVIVVSPSTPSIISSPAILIDDLDGANGIYDACPTTRTGTPALIGWHEHGTTALRVGYVDASGVLGSPTTGHPSVLTYAANLLAASPIQVAFGFVGNNNTDVICAAFVDVANLGTIAFFSGGNVGTSNPIALMTGGSQVANVAVDMQRIALTVIIESDGSASAWSAWEETAVATSNHTVTMGKTTIAIGTPELLTVRSICVASRAFFVGAIPYFVAVHDTTFFNTYLTLSIVDGTVNDPIAVGRHVPGSAAGAPTRKHMPSVNVVSNVATFCLPVRDRLISENNDKFTETGLRVFSLDFDSEASHQTQQLGRGLYMAGACPRHYDGLRWTEQGFHFGPELITTTPAAGGSMTSATTYEYRAWYEWADAQGEVHRGPSSVGSLVTMGGADTQVTLTLPTLRVTQKTNVRICVARSLSAKTGKTAQLFRVTSLDPTTAGSANGYVANDKNVDTVTFIDRMSDITLATQEEIYTDGGILSNDPVAFGAVIARSKNRLFVTDPSDGNLIRASQELSDGYGVEFAPEITVKVDPFGGDVTAIASQDDRVVVFKQSSIFLFNGDGPLANGDTATSGFTVPQLVTSDVGCTEPASIVLTANGHMFKSAKGIYLLDRSGSVNYVGAAVEGFNSQDVRRGIVMPDRTSVLFLTSAGSTLHYDYLFGQWSTFTNHAGYDAAVVNGAFNYLRTDGRMFRETIGSYSDAGTRIRMRLETAWIKMLDQLQGFQRFWYAHLLGTWVSPHQLGVQYQTDFTTAWSDEFWLDATGLSSSSGWITGPTAQTIGVDPITGSNYGAGQYSDGPYGGTTPDLYQWRIDINEKGQAIQFRFEDFEAAGFSGASFELTELLITGGVKGNAIRPFTAARST